MSPSSLKQAPVLRRSSLEDAATSTWNRTWSADVSGFKPTVKLPETLLVSSAMEVFERINNDPEEVKLCFTLNHWRSVSKEWMKVNGTCLPVKISCSWSTTDVVQLQPGISPSDPRPAFDKENDEGGSSHEESSSCTAECLGDFCDLKWIRMLCKCKK